MTREQWKAHVEALKASGLPISEYAAKAGVHPGTLASWRSKLKGPVPKKKQVQITLVQEPTVAPAPVVTPDAGVIELVVGAVRILIRGRVEAEALMPVLAALGERR